MSRYFETQEIDVFYDKVQALAGVSIAMDEGEVISVVGANGAGKTTMLRAVTNLTPIARGEIWFDGERIDGLAPDRVAARGIAMVPEGRHVYPLMNVRDNLLMGAFLRRDKAGIRNDMDAIFQRFPRLKERYRQQASTLSGGEQQMVAIGRALMSGPRLLLMDEPSLGLAPMMVREIARSIRDINRDERVSIILVEQNSRMALRLSRHAYVMETGRVALEGRSADLMENEKVRRVYLGG